ncbi:MAG: LysM peptidoglycan-binding domain-containing protein [Thermoanaerobaculia bacterium]|nr:LysM peptidoglycan-binding domain-containing protein [Thermoanaerobaculia bacterium]
MKRIVPGAVWMLAACLIAGAGWAADTPPQDLHKVGDHWTAWTPPTEFPEGAEIHVIEPGDTLWDLSATFYGDPYLWPQLWERNQYILDAHWIYPGDPLVVSVEVTPVEELGEVDLEEDREEPGERLRLDRGVSPPRPLGTESDIYCSGYIGDPKEEFGYRITGSEYQVLSPKLGSGFGDEAGYGEVATVKYDLTQGDIVYVDGGRAAGLTPGSVFFIMMRGELVRNPSTREVVGRFYGYRGRLRVLSVQEETAIGEIVQACGVIHVDDVLKPFVPQPVPLGRRSPLRPANAPVAPEILEGAPMIVKSKDDQISLGEENVVFIDRGLEAGIAPGDIYTIYRPNRPGFPPVVLGELAVLSVHDRSAVGKILKSRYTVHVGDLLNPK